MNVVRTLIAAMPPGGAYVRLVRRGVTYTGGPYACLQGAGESALRLSHDVPDVAAVSIAAVPALASPAGERRWYARAVFRADGYTALAGPFASRKAARADLMELADRGRIGPWHEWDIDYHRA